MKERIETLEEKIYSNKKFAVFLTVFAATQLAVVLSSWNSPLIWDSSVYAGMGKRIFSGWQYGIWESFRPLMLPVILGSLWKAGMPLVGFPRLLGVLISVTGIIGIYVMLKNFFQKNTAFFTTAILMSSMIFYKYSHYALTGVPSAILVFTGAYMAQRDRKIFSGFFSSLGFLTRFPAAVAAPGIAAYLFFDSLRDGICFEAFKRPLIYTVSFFATTIPYFAYNIHLYGDAFRPLINGATIPAMNPDKYFYGVYYLLEAVKAQPFILFLPLGIFVVLKSRDWDYGAFLAPMISLYVFFTVYSHKEPRFMLLFLPFLALFSAEGLRELKSREYVSQDVFVKIASASLMVMMLVSFSVSFGQSQWVNQDRVEFLEETGELEGVVAGNDPVVVLYGDFEFVPIRPENLKEIYGNIKGEADYYAFNSCSWYCTPAIDNCESMLSNFSKGMRSNYSEKFSLQGSSCNYTIYEDK